MPLLKQASDDANLEFRLHYHSGKQTMRDPIFILSPRHNKTILQKLVES